MRRLAKREPVYLVVIRTTNDTGNANTENDSKNEEPRKQCIVTINDDQTQTQYPKEVQAILDDYTDVFPRELPAGLPPQRDLDHRIELVPGAEPSHRAPYRMSP